MATVCWVKADDLAFVEKLVQGRVLRPASVTVNGLGHTVVDFGKHGFGWIEVDDCTGRTWEMGRG